MNVLTQATNTGRWNAGGRPLAADAVVHDAVEEVDREERAEEHDLRPDEQEHPEHARARPASCSGSAAGRAWSCAVGVPRCSACALMRTSGGDDVLDRQAGLLAQPLDQVAPQPAAPLAREGRDDDLVDALVVDRLHRGGERVGVDDLAVRVDAVAAQLGERAAQAPVGLGVLLVVALRRDDQEARRPLLAARCGSGRGAPSRRRSRSRSRGRSSRRRSSPRDDVLRPGWRRRRARMSSTTLRRIQPERSAGCVETMISSTGGSSCASASLTACTGPVSTTKPCAEIPASRSALSVFSSRRPAEARRVSS